MKKLSVIIFLFSILIFNSCATKSALKSSESSETIKDIELKLCKNLRPVYVTNSKKIFLLAPQYSRKVVDAVQLLEGSFGNSKFALMSYTQIDTKGIGLSLFNDFGTDMGNLSFGEEAISFDSAYFPSALPAEYIVNDIQNAFYDFDALKLNYKASDLRFEKESSSDSEDANSEKRKIYDGKKLIEEILILENTVTIKNYLRGYEYKLIEVEE